MVCFFSVCLCGCVHYLGFGLFICLCIVFDLVCFLCFHLGFVWFGFIGFFDFVCGLF